MVANREDGYFQVNVVERGVTPQVVKLNVCQNCLDAIVWKGFRNDIDRSERVKRVAAFNLKEFFAKYPRDLIAVKPNHSSDTAPINDYTDDWGDVSERVKRARLYCCSSCKLELGQRRSRFLNVHHRNGLKHDNSEGNLELLCLRCHAKKPMHEHMLGTPEYLEFVSRHAN